MNHSIPGTRALRTFEAAGRLLNFTRAAEEVGLTPAAVSYQIKEIEDQLGVALFTRTSRTIRLTPAGAVFLEATSDALEGLKRAAGHARRISHGTRDLRLSLGPRFAASWFLPRLSRFRERNPKLELRFDITDVARNFDTDDVDIAIRFGAGHYRGVRSERLFGTVVVPICSPRLIEAGRTIHEPKDLLGHTLCHVNCRVGDMIWPTWSMWMAAAGIDDFDDSRCISFTDSGSVIQAVVDGEAVGLAESTMISSDIAHGRIIKLFDISVNMPEEYAYHLVYPESSDTDDRVQAFRNWIFNEIDRDTF